MVERLPAANYKPDQKRTAEYCDLIFASGGDSTKNSLPLLVRGTPFQIKVWEALLRIPTGSRISYKKLAQAVGSSGASRAVGSAVGKNPVAILIPCHRVIREDGLLGGYHWGLERKLALLGTESVSRISVLEPNTQTRIQFSLHIASIAFIVAVAAVQLILQPFPVLHDYPEWMYQGHIAHSLLTNGATYTGLYEFLPRL